MALRLQHASDFLTVCRARSPEELRSVVAGGVDVLLMEGRSPWSTLDLGVHSPRVIVADRAGPPQPGHDDFAVVHTDELDRLIGLLLEQGDRASAQIRLSDMELRQEVRAAVRSADSLELAIDAVFEGVGRHVDLVYGEAWFRGPDEGIIELSHQWSRGPADGGMRGAMRAGLSAVAIDPGHGMPSRAWWSRTPILIPDVATWEGFVRRSIAQDFGLETMVAMRAHDGDEPVAALLFFIRRHALTPGAVRLIRTTVGPLGDLLRRKTFEGQLGAGDVLLDSTIGAMGEAVCVVRAHDGRIHSCNDAMAGLFGSTRRELIGRPIADLYAQVDAPDGKAPRGVAELSNGGTAEHERLLRRCSGEVFRAEQLLSALRDERGRVIATIVVFRDRSEAERRDQAIDALRWELARVSRVAMLGQLAAGIMHNVSQPLTAAESQLAYAERLADLPAESEPLRGAIADARRELGRVRDGYLQLRAFVKRRDPRRVALDPNEIVGEVLRLLRAVAARECVRIESDLDPDAGPVAVDRVQIEQVLLNLLQNSIEAFLGAPPPRLVVVSTRREPENCEIIVRDNGPGLSLPAHSAMAPFQTTKEEGLGMGLAISRYIIEAHGGAIEFEEKGAPGVIVRLRLPYDRRG